MLSRVAQVAERTKELAGKALEALDVPEETVERPSAPSTPTPGLEKSSAQLEEDTCVLAQLVEVLTGQPTANPIEAGEVLVTQLELVRESAAASGSLVTLLNELVSAETTKALLEALEAEQEENLKLRQRLATELNGNGPSDTRIELLEERCAEFEKQSEMALIELETTRRMLEKVVREKADLELERDDGDRVDARIMRSAFTTLCAQIDNKSVRDGVLLVMAEMLQVSHEDRVACRMPSIERKPSGLGDEFIRFLNDELGGAPPPL